MDGEGIFTWPDKRKYTGQYMDDKKHGYGLFEWYNFFKNCTYINNFQE